jgi:starch-binding outer membrane protein SusE/F
MKTKLLFTFILLLSLQFVTAQPIIGFLGEFGNWGDDVNMTTADNVNFTKANYYLPSGGLKFRQDDAWTNSWGGDTFPSGTTTGNNIPVTPNFYNIAFNIATGDYTFTPVGPSNQNVSIIGDFNGWAADLVLTTTDNISYTAINVPLTSGGLKFRRDANWAVGYGGPGLTGTASPTGANIAITTNANYDITFNIESLAYTIVETVLGLDDLNKNVNISYINNNKTLKINGYSGKTIIKTFDIYGRLIQRFDVQVQNNFAKEINLPQNQLSFIVIEGEHFNKTLKVIAHL